MKIFIPLYNTICEFCRAQTYLTNENFRPHMQKHHRFEADFTCSICKRCFSGFKSFIKHVTQHEEQLATDSVREVNEIILKSKKPKLSEPSPVFQEVTNVIESTETVLPTQSIPFIFSALGECKPKTALLEKKSSSFHLILAKPIAANSKIVLTCFLLLITNHILVTITGLPLVLSAFFVPKCLQAFVI